jgi:excisionase family DNA binding protein
MGIKLRYHIAHYRMNEQLSFAISEAAEIAGCHYATIHRKVCAGEIKILDSPGRIRIPKSELDRFLSKTVVYTPRKKAQRKVKKEAVAA